MEDSRVIAIARVANTFHLNPIDVAKTDQFDIKFLVACNNLVAKESAEAVKK